MSYLAKVYNAIADSYDNLRLTNLDKEENRHSFKYLLDHGYTRGDIIDGGSGTGRLIDYLDEYVPSGKYLGVDCAEEMVAIARVKHPSYAFSVAEIRKMPVLDRAVDNFVSMFGSFSYLISTMEVEDSLREVLRVLRPSGKLLLMVWSAWAIESGVFEVSVGGQRLARKQYTAHTLRAALSGGFEDVRVRGISGRWLGWLPSWTPRWFYRGALWVEARTWGRWWPNTCRYLICEANAPR